MMNSPIVEGWKGGSGECWLINQKRCAEDHSEIQIDQAVVYSEVTNTTEFNS